MERKHFVMLNFVVFAINATTSKHFLLEKKDDYRLFLEVYMHDFKAFAKRVFALQGILLEKQLTETSVFRNIKRCTNLVFKQNI